MANRTQAIGYTRYDEGYIDASQVQSDLVDFPVLIPMPDDALDFDGPYPAEQGGGDIAIFIVEANGDWTRVPIQVELFLKNNDPSLGYGIVWAKMNVSSVSNTNYIVAWGIEGREQPDATDQYGSEAVYDSNYLAVYNMDDFQDSTVNGNHATPFNGLPDTVDGITGVAQQFNGVQAYASVPTLGLLNQVTVEVWFYQDTQGSQRALASANNYSAGLNHYKVNTDTVALGTSGSGNLTSSPVVIDTWYHSSYTYNVSGLTELFLDGVSQGTQGVPAVQWNGTGQEIGHEHTNYAAGARYFEGRLDLIRYSNIVRSDGWIEFTADNSKIGQITNIPANDTQELILPLELSQHAHNTASLTGAQTGGTFSLGLTLDSLNKFMFTGSYRLLGERPDNFSCTFRARNTTQFDFGRHSFSEGNPVEFEGQIAEFTPESGIYNQTFFKSGITSSFSTIALGKTVNPKKTVVLWSYRPQDTGANYGQDDIPTVKISTNGKLMEIDFGTGVPKGALDYQVIEIQSLDVQTFGSTLSLATENQAISAVNLNRTFVNGSNNPTAATYGTEQYRVVITSPTNLQYLRDGTTVNVTSYVHVCEFLHNERVLVQQLTFAGASAEQIDITLPVPVDVDRSIIVPGLLGFIYSPNNSGVDSSDWSYGTAILISPTVFRYERATTGQAARITFYIITFLQSHNDFQDLRGELKDRLIGGFQ